MANSIFLPGTAANLVGQTQNPTLTQNPDAGLAQVAMGRNGEVITSDVHGWSFVATARGRVFTASAAGVTGVAPLAPGGTTSGFMVYNPVGSGVLMEVLELVVEPLTATDVVGTIGLEFGAPPTTVTNADSVRNALVGGNSQTPQGKASHGSTIVAMTFLRWLPIFVQTTAGVLQGSSCIYTPNGNLVIAPGGAINIVSSSTQSTNLWSQSATWAEWPV
jgi:hypothetical protein